MGAPKEIAVAIFLSWTVLVVETADRLRRISNDPYASTFSRLGENLTIATLFSTVLVALFIFFAARRRNWARIGLLFCTLGGWCLWLLWLAWWRAGVEYVWWQWLGYGGLTAMELAALILSFSGKGARWYQSAAR
jgi:hypothetical protein